MLPGFRSRCTMPARCALSSALGYLNRDRERPIERQRASCEPLGQRLALEILHDQEVNPVLAADVMERADVRMIQRGDGARLTLEALASLGIVGDLRRQDLDRHVPTEPGVAGAVDLAHPARAEPRVDLIRANLPALERRLVRPSRQRPPPWRPRRRRSPRATPPTPAAPAATRRPCATRRRPDTPRRETPPAPLAAVRAPRGTAPRPAASGLSSCAWNAATNYSGASASSSVGFPASISETETHGRQARSRTGGASPRRLDRRASTRGSRPARPEGQPLVI